MPIAIGTVMSIAIWVICFRNHLMKNFSFVEIFASTFECSSSFSERAIGRIDPVFPKERIPLTLQFVYFIVGVAMFWPGFQVAAIVANAQPAIAICLARQ